MKRLVALAMLPLAAAAQEPGGTHELIGQLGSRATLMTLHATRNPDASWQLAGEYVILPTMQRRFVEGESSPELGVTTLREGDTPILFGQPAGAELRGVWRGGSFRGARFAPGGQERERFEFSDEFPSLAAYSASVHCRLQDGTGQTSLDYAVSEGRVRSFAWRSASGAKGCAVSELEQQPMKGGIRLAAGSCGVTLRDLGEGLRVSADEGCSERCEAPAKLEALLVDRRGNCRTFRPRARLP